LANADKKLGQVDPGSEKSLLIRMVGADMGDFQENPILSLVDLKTYFFGMQGR
jgi:hypothetical protein